MISKLSKPQNRLLIGLGIVGLALTSATSYWVFSQFGTKPTPPAIEAMKRAETELEQAYIRAPMAGQILKIQTRSGEKISDSGIADLAQNDQMVAVSEVYQSDIANVKVGQTATITGQAFNGELQGTVSEIGLQVNKQNVFSNQSGENLDRRVIDVKIDLKPGASQQVSGLTNLQVQTSITPN